MRSLTLLTLLLLLAPSLLNAQQTPAPPPGFISPARPVLPGLAPALKSKLIKDSNGERVYVIIFSRGDEAISGLTDFALQNHITDAHFTAIGAVSSALLAWLNLPQKLYRPIPVHEQVEVVSFIGDIAAFNSRPVVHAHSVLSHQDGTTTAGHTFELHVNPTLEVFLTSNDKPLTKVQDVSGIKLIDPTQ